ncbi:DUF3231 family protein [Siminovitchia acidinfaciens]|uniref:DUF3231 family protein n=1 Tax=Siminovitchia acidinfaciens TaxID=2321395 RepID=A0A429Y4B9_9BACI|nr:DUF3231 family protein [Siminovitchia acidinfaciens]RST76275.1 DUF3231 family protein [Siminovitchia acidinfaciens]
MGFFNDNSKDEPMHYGEVFNIWSYLSTAKILDAGYQTHLNHAGDEDLQKLLKVAIEGGKQQINQIEELLKENGVGLPPTPPERAKACSEDIPIGARFPDPEIASYLWMNVAAGLMACSTIMGQSIREDITLLFGSFHAQITMLGAKVLNLNKEKGWLVLPPMHHSKAEDC